jgi:uncharacterized phage protein (predicted DNA packaging)
VNTLNIEEIKEFLRIDYSEEDIFIHGLQLAAEEYMSNAGVNKDYNKELYKLAVKLLVSHWYENRTLETTGPNFHKVSFSLDTIITQLKYTQVEVIST